MKQEAMRQNRTACLVLSIVLCPCLFAAEKPNYTFQRLTIEQGLSQSAVNCILKDSRGFLWFGTKDGLNRYDGYNFKIFRSDPSRGGNLTDNLIYCLAEDTEGNLWIGTQAGGLNRYDRKTERFEAYKPDHGSSRAGAAGEIRAICPSPDGKLWLGTLSGLILFDPRTKTFRFFRHDPNDGQSLSGDRIFSLCLDSRGALWVGFQNESFNRFDPGTGKAERFRIEALPWNSGLLATVDAIIEDSDGILWIGSHQGLIRIDPRTRAMTTFHNNPADPASLADSPIRNICRDPQGMIWLALLDKGLDCFDPSTGRCLHFRARPNDPRYPSYDSLNCLLMDPSGILWVGTNGAGIIKLILQNMNFRVFTQIDGDPYSLHMKSLRFFCEDTAGSLLIGGYGGLDGFDPERGRFIRLYSEDVYCILPDTGIPGTMLIGLEGEGLKAFEREKRAWAPFPPPQGIPGAIFVLRKDRKGRIWIGTGGGLYCYDILTRSLIHYEKKPADESGLSHNSVKTILEDVAGTLWIGTDGGGLNILDESTGIIRYFTHDPSDPATISHSRVSSIMEDSRGRIWIGTQGGGLSLWHPETGTFSSFREKDGLPNDVVYGILEDAQGRLWLSTNKGISRFDPELKIFRNFDVNDGLPSNEFNGGAYFKTSAGELMFGGINGFVMFKPEEIQDFSFVPPVVLTDFQIFNKSVPITEGPDAKSPLRSSITETKELKLSHRDRVFSFEFAALNFIFPEKNQYAYRMEGFETDWNYVGTRRYAHYTNLSPGRYVFRVKGSNNNGVWNEDGVSIKIRITPPFWRTSWFLSFCGLMVILATLGVFNLRLRQLTRKKKELEALVVVRTQELKEASLKDPLTGLRNRRFISEVLAGDLQAYISHKTYLLEPRVNRRKVPEDTVFGIFLLDIDHFKEVNDEMGHDAGDHFLVQFAAILKSSVRDDDVIVRFGGEEFLIILKYTDPAYLDRFARKIKDKIEAAAFAISGRALKKTCSIGHIQYPLHLARPKLYDFDSTLILVDQGLYHAKKNGRNMAVRILPGQTLPDETQGGPRVQGLDSGLRQGLFSLNEIR